ncbi:chaplin family protein [Actinomadura sp. NPDC048394]|uniref:chaplin family protein n=1 Tax=Actinomadura sp. NPDC048394 TaxID=3158223 RepID=UPI0033D76E02
MRTWAKSTARNAALTASFVALGVSVVPANAFADATNGDGSVLGGNQVDLPISAPVDVSGNGAGIVGSGHGVSKGGASVLNGGGGGQHTSGTGSVGGGNQVSAPISAPVNACGNAVALIGKADAGCKGGSSVLNGGGSGGQKTSGEHSVLGGNQVNAPISAPVDVCGNAVAIIGKAEAGCKGGATVHNGGGAGHGGGGQTTDGALGVIAGNQVNAPISAPVNVCGNAVAIVGEAVAGCEGGAIVKNGGHTGAGQKTSGLHSVLGGNQANAPVSAPVDVCGNAIGNALAECEGGASVRNGGHGSGGQTTDGVSSVIGGNQANAPISVPATVCGNAAAIVGEAGAYCEGGAHVRSSSGGQHTSGTGSVVGGNQGNAPITAPVDVCGNAAAVVGEAAAHCNGQTLVEGPQGGGRTSGNGSVGGGNQAHAPAKAPVDVCGNVGAVVGRSLAHCQDGPGFGGYHPYARSAGETPTPLPVNPGLPVLPKLPATANHRDGGPGALPATGLPHANVPVTGLPDAGQAVSGAAAQVNGIPATKSVPVSDALSATNLLPGTGEQRTAEQRTGAPSLGPVPGSQLPVTQSLPVAQSLPAAQGLPVGQSLPVDQSLPVAQNVPVGQNLPGLQSLPGAQAVPVHGNLPTVNNALGGGMTPTVTPKVNGLQQMPAAGKRTVRTGGNGMTIATLPVNPGAVTGNAGKALPAVPVVPVAANARSAGTGNPLPAPGLPGTHGVKLPKTGAVKLPAAGNVALPAGAVKSPKKVTDLGPVRTVAEREPLAPAAEDGSLWVLGMAAIAAAFSGAVALTRRLRPVRR